MTVLTKLRRERDTALVERDKWKTAYLEVNGLEVMRALEKIRDSGDCLCEHDDENCCVRVGQHCPTCIAAAALRDPKEPKV